MLSPRSVSSDMVTAPWSLSVFTCTRGSAEGRPHSHYITHAVCAAAAAAAASGQAQRDGLALSSPQSAHSQHTLHPNTLCTFVDEANFTALTAIIVMSV